MKTEKISKEELLLLLNQLYSENLEAEAESISEHWTRSLVPLPRLSISAGQTNYLIPWHEINQIEADISYLTLHIYCSIGVFTVTTKTSQEPLYKWLQIERVKEITKTGCKIEFISSQSEESDGIS